MIKNNQSNKVFRQAVKKITNGERWNLISGIFGSVLALVPLGYLIARIFGVTLFPYGGILSSIGLVFLFLYIFNAFLQYSFERKQNTIIMGVWSNASELISLVKNGNWKAAIALADCGTKETVQELSRELIENTNLVMRVEAAWSLGKIGSKEAIPVLIKAMKEDVRLAVRKGVANALLDIGSKEAVPVLLEIKREDWSRRFRRYATKILRKMSKKYGYEDLESFIQETEGEL